MSDIASSETNVDSAIGSSPDVNESPLTSRQTLVLMFSVMVVALCGIVYELIIAAVSSYLLGNSVYQFSITIGFFMFAMGLGSYLSKWIDKNLVSKFVLIEIAVALIGGVSSCLLFMLFPFPSFYRPVMFTLIILIGTLVGLEIPILTRILSRSTTWKQSIAHVLSLDYLGALIGSVAFPILMLPSLGLFQSSFAIGLLNVGVAFVALFVFGKSLHRFWMSLFGAVIALTVLVAGLVFSEQLTNFAESKMYSDRIVYTEQSQYQRIVITKNFRNNDLRMYLDKHIQFASIDEHRYHEALVHPVMSVPGPRERVLILGGGDGMAVREVLKYPEVKSILMIDIDPAVTRLCSTFEPIRKLNQGALDDPRLTIVNEDAFSYLLNYMGRISAENPHFDRVIIDLPDPHNEVLDKLYSKEFYEIVRGCMSPQGAMVSQCSSPFFARNVYWCIRNTMEAASFDVKSYRVPMVSFGIWGFHLCSAKPKTGEAVNEFQVDIDESMCRYLNNEVFQGCTVFGKDIQPPENLPINRTFEPVLYSMYQKQMKK